ncbi:hypothetical protein BVI2075_390028 [Burkholderia vietnamiensis]|nr:hypothetical protein BVI2075_390028 [Burkholderia vietnamiensis]
MTRAPARRAARGAARRKPDEMIRCAKSAQPRGSSPHPPQAG